MIIWLDAQLSPRLTRWIGENCGVERLLICDLGLRDAENPEIFQKARDAGTIVLTKDEDFVHLVEQNNPLPQVIWIASGNMPNECFKLLLLKTLHDAISLFESGEAVVEIKRATE